MKIGFLPFRVRSAAFTFTPITRISSIAGSARNPSKWTNLTRRRLERESIREIILGILVVSTQPKRNDWAQVKLSSKPFEKFF